MVFAVEICPCHLYKLCSAFGQSYESIGSRDYELVLGIEFQVFDHHPQRAVAIIVSWQNSLDL